MISNIKIGNESNSENNDSEYNIYKRKTEELIDMLIKTDLGKEDDFKKIYNFIETNFKGGRLLYSVISSKIYGLNEVDINSLESLCDQLVSYVFILQNKEGKDNTVNTIVLKLSDHINLALAQERYVQHFNDGKLNEKFNKVDDFMKKADDLDQKVGDLDNDIKNMNSQVISILGIFTAISFVVFGGISSASSILSNIASTSLPKLGILASIWSIAICNMVYFLLYFMAKFTKINIKTNLRFNAPVYRRHPYIFLINVILCVILFLSVWFYIIEITTGDSWIKMIVSNNKDFLLFGTIVIIGIIIIFFIWLFFKMNSDKNDW